MKKFFAPLLRYLYEAFNFGRPVCEWCRMAWATHKFYDSDPVQPDVFCSDCARKILFTPVARPSNYPHDAENGCSTGSAI